MKAPVRIKDATVIQSIDPDLTMGVNNVVIGHNNANMDDRTLGIVEKSQVPWFAFFDKAKSFALFGLLRGIPFYGIST
jgi:hypothetical protein